MGRTPTTLTDPRTWMSVWRSGEPAIVAEGAESHTSGQAHHRLDKLAGSSPRAAAAAPAAGAAAGSRGMWEFLLQQHMQCALVNPA